MPLKPRTLLYPLCGRWILRGVQGSLVDTVSVISVAAGTIGPIGFLGLQVGYTLHALFHVPNSLLTQVIVIIVAVVIYTISTVSGIQRGIQLLSKCNVILAALLLLYFLMFGPFKFIISSFVKSAFSAVHHLIPMAMYHDDSKWIGKWTIFFWGWFIGYAPVMSIFIARISKGRSIRELVMTMAIIAPLITFFGFTVVGGSGLAYEVANPGTISHAYLNDGLPAVLLAITRHFPLSVLISLLFMVLSTIFIITTSDSITYTISVVMCGDLNPDKLMRIFWAVTMGAISIILIYFGKGGITQLQFLIVITAGPASLFILPSLWYAPYASYQMLRKQQALEQGP